MKVTGAQAIVQLLERQGVRTLAGVPGGFNLPLYDALSASTRIHHVLARHEQGGGFIAQGIARATGKVGVCLATSGPGVTNVLTAVADAKLDSIPLVCISGQVPTSMIGTDAFQEVDTYGLGVPITKHNFLVRSAAELVQTLPEAFRIAASGRPGPVWVDVPKNVQTETIELDAWPEPGVPDAPPPADAAGIRGAAAMINAAHRPMLYVGGGVVAAGASELATRLAEVAGLPAVMTLMALGAIPADHPRSLGMLGMHGARCTNLAMERCDLLIAVGARFDDRATGKLAQFCPNAKVIHIDIDASELGKLRTPQVAIRADARTALEALLPHVQPAQREAWLAEVDALRRSHPLVLDRADDPCSPYGLIVQAASMLDDDTIVTTDVGQHQMFVAQAYPFRKPRRWLTSGGLGTMGFGLPAAIGAALACREATVVCFSGDGSLMMNMQELVTAVEENVNVKVLLMNNNSLGLVRQQQELFYGNRIFAADFHARPDFVAIARGCGMRGYNLDAADDPLATLAHALAEPGPCLVNVPIDAHDKVFPMVPPGGANCDMIGGEAHVHA